MSMEYYRVSFSYHHCFVSNSLCYHNIHQLRNTPASVAGMKRYDASFVSHTCLEMVNAKSGTAKAADRIVQNTAVNANYSVRVHGSSIVWKPVPSTSLLCIFSDPLGNIARQPIYPWYHRYLFQISTPDTYVLNYTYAHSKPLFNHRTLSCGIHLYLITDSGVQVTNKLFETSYTMLGVRNLTATRYHSQIDVHAMKYK